MVDLSKFTNPEYCLKAVKKKGSNIQYVVNQTKELSLIAVKKNGENLKYIKKQDSEICLEAVKQTSDAIKFVNGKFMSESLCLLAVQNDNIYYPYIIL